MGKRVALALASGAARGLAHVGVIDELNNQGYEICSIAGSSMGALVGSFYAAGTFEAYKEWAVSLDKYDIFKLVDFNFGLIAAARLVIAAVSFFFIVVACSRRITCLSAKNNSR